MVNDAEQDEVCERCEGTGWLDCSRCDGSGRCIYCGDREVPCGCPATEASLENFDPPDPPETDFDEDDRFPY